MTVSDTMRISGSASAASIASTSNGLMKSIIAPVTRTVVASASCSTTVVSQSCACELLAHVDVGVAHARADERPVVVVAGVEQVVEIDRLMGAVEVADADVEDAGA